jgi:hypothetical protein
VEARLEAADSLSAGPGCSPESLVEFGNVSFVVESGNVSFEGAGSLDEERIVVSLSGSLSDMVRVVTWKVDVMQVVEAWL